MIGFIVFICCAAAYLRIAWWWAGHAARRQREAHIKHFDNLDPKDYVGEFVTVGVVLGLIWPVSMPISFIKRSVHLSGRKSFFPDWKAEEEIKAKASEFHEQAKLFSRYQSEANAKGDFELAGKMQETAKMYWKLADDVTKGHA